ncbi:hypothetical protein RI367_004580 [Sorochytrium milnesiophthora]
MPILGIGTDILQMSRLARLFSSRGHTSLADHRLCTRVLSPTELDLLRSQLSTTDTDEVAAAVRFLALRWTAKEAFYKAVYPYCRPTWKQVSVMQRDRKPELVVHDEQLQQWVGRVHMSYSHDGDYATATVLVEGHTAQQKAHERHYNSGA